MCAGFVGTFLVCLKKNEDKIHPDHFGYFALFSRCFPYLERLDYGFLYAGVIGSFDRKISLDRIVVRYFGYLAALFVILMALTGIRILRKYREWLPLSKAVLITAFYLISFLLNLPFINQLRNYPRVRASFIHFKRSSHEISRKPDG